MPADSPRMDATTAALERELIEHYLRSRGQTRESLTSLNAPESAELLRSAAEYASLRLAEMHAKARYLHDLHGS